MNRKWIAVPVLGVALVTGCHSGQAAKSGASAFATSSQGQFDKAQAQKIAQQCLPKSETAQLKLAEPVKGKASRASVEQCLAIPQQNRQAFGNALLDDAMHGHLSTKAGRDVFLGTTVPELVVKYR